MAGRGFNAVKRVQETLSMKSMKQSDYEYMERLYEHDTSRTVNARICFKRPPYYITEKGKLWDQIRKDFTN